MSRLLCTEILGRADSDQLDLQNVMHVRTLIRKTSRSRDPANTVTLQKHSCKIWKMVEVGLAESPWSLTDYSRRAELK